MKFGAVPTSQAEGAILAHSLKTGSGRLRKGLTLEAGHLEALEQAGIDEVVVARLERGDLHEDAAARVVAQAVVPDPASAQFELTQPFTGRVNIVAVTAGVVVMDVARLNALNAVHPMITLATVAPFQQLGAGQMAATVKIISYGVAEADVQRAAAAGAEAMRLAPVQHGSASLILTTLEGGGLADKGRAAIEARLQTLGMSLAETLTVPHDTAALAAAIAQAKGDMILILTASATSDIADVAPEALRAAGGQVERFGIPVDPGNLLFLGHLDARPVIGLPNSARSPVLHGVDWVLSRMACGLSVSDAEIAAMGVGGLLKEIPNRPMPRDRRR